MAAHELNGASAPPPVPPAAGASPESGRALSVGDALGYLDAVKKEFETRPDVYNKFLDIMKDFKSTAIDTPGVIERVSELFFGNSELIEGFNTFLPQGYHINAAPNQGNITVVTPQGTIVARPGDLAHEFRIRAAQAAAQAQAQAGQAYDNMSLLPDPPRPVTPVPAPIPQQPAQQPQQQQMSYSPGSQAATVLNSFAPPKNQSDASVALEFSRAIQFLNKIKTRFPEDPDTYKIFLEILQSYRVQQAQGGEHDQAAQAARDQKLMQEVYKQVAQLFQGQTELIAEFKDFLPHALAMVIPPSSRGPPPDAHSGSPHKSVPAKRARKPQAPKADPIKSEPARDKKRPRVSKTASGAKGRAPSPPVPVQVQRGGSQPLGPVSSKPMYADELSFFETIRRALDSRDAYDDLLRLLALYARDVLDAREVLDRASEILPPTLLRTLGSMLGEDAQPPRGPPGSLRTAPPPPIDLPRLPAHEEALTGPSYRLLPPSEAKLATSGRDALARSVLNDLVCSHPTWQSEETAFGAHKRNAYEEQMHRCEDERHEFAIVREGLSRTIAVLEPLGMRLEGMAPDVRAAYRLRPDLGGPSPRIYERTIKKIYGRDVGAQVLQELQDAPGAAVPVVLSRLKIKDAEWRKAQREWEPTWRAVDSRNFYKSLDTAGLSFKANDKKGITAKAFVAEIEAARKAASHGGGKGKERAYPVQLDFADQGVVRDSLRLVGAFLEHAQGAYSPHERRALERFLRTFTSTLLPPAAGEAETNGHAHTNGHRHDEEDSDSEEEIDFDEESVRQWIRESVPAGMKPLRDAPVRARPFFANTTFYTLLRLLHLLYSRLLLAKAAGASHASERFVSLAANPTAVALGLDDAQGAAATLRGVLMLYSNPHAPAQNPLYSYILAAAVKVFEGELEQAVFEEHARWFVGPRAHVLFTLDKLCAALAKQAQASLADSRARELWTLFRHPTNSSESRTRAGLMRYRRAAVRRLGQDENLFRAEWSAEERRLVVRIVGGDEPSVGGTSEVERWREYVDSWVLESPTEWLVSPSPAMSRQRRAPVFLKRSREVGEEGSVGSGAKKVDGALGIRVSLGTYALFYEAGSEECWVRTQNAEEGVKAAAREEERRRVMSARWGRT